jgi:hypothetical protein
MSEPSTEQQHYEHDDQNGAQANARASKRLMVYAASEKQQRQNDENDQHKVCPICVSLAAIATMHKTAATIVLECSFSV